ncbi:MAG: hypothetical protein J6D23_02420 [Clostridia bacterium]|nr:hypothetical protein [Clostridia bacterium]
MRKLITIDCLTEKRKKLWNENQSIDDDKLLTEAIARKILSEENLRNEVFERPYLLIECCFCVVDKKRRTTPFFLNDVQKDFIAKLETLGRQKPFFILKGRQQGFTTLITAIQLSFAIVRKNFSGFTVADRDDNTKAIFTDKAKAMYNDLPKILKPKEKFNSVNELFFDKLNSSWRIASASSNVGRSRTLSFIHFSEVAFYKCSISDLQKSIAEAATQDALCVYETTANGFNEAKALWDNGSCHNLFYEWWKTKEYVSNEYEFLETKDKWLIERLKILEQKGLSREQITWYAKKYASYIDKSSIKQEYPCSPEEAFIVSGDCVFDKDIISNYLSRFDVLSTQGSFKYEKKLLPIYNDKNEIVGCERRITDIELIDDTNGFISIVEKPYCITKDGITYKKPYVIGADTAGCGEDYFTAKVLDNTNGRCVATLRVKHIDEDLFAEQLYCLGTYYNNAFIAVEINYSRHPVRVLHDLGYTNLYSQGLQNKSISLPEHRYGFLTTSSTKPIIISNLVAIMRESIDLETDRETLKELSSFVRGVGGKTGAASGSHDDLVMASAIAHYIGGDYTHKMEIIDTGVDVLAQFYNNPQEETNKFMEW